MKNNYKTTIKIKEILLENIQKKKKIQVMILICNDNA